MNNGLGNYKQVDFPKKPIDVNEFVKFIEDWNEQLRPLLDLRLKIKEEEAERNRLKSIMELNNVVNHFHWSITPYVPAIITENS